jgi:hypothetical protein
MVPAIGRMSVAQVPLESHIVNSDGQTVQLM